MGDKQTNESLITINERTRVVNQRRERKRIRKLSDQCYQVNRGFVGKFSPDDLQKQNRGKMLEYLD